MFKDLKPFYFILLSVCILAAPSSTRAESEESVPLYNSEKKQEGVGGGGMKSMHWNTPKPKKPEKPEVEDVKKASIENQDEGKKDTKDAKEAPPVKEKEMTEGEKLWKKYKDLADKGKAEEEARKKKKSSDKSAEKETETKEEDAEIDEETETAQNEANEKEAEKSGGFLAGILKDYQESQKNKGQMNSRSFGKID